MEKTVMKLASDDLGRMWNLGWNKLAELWTEDGYYKASEGDTGLYPTLFGRDSLWILLFLLRVAERHQPVRSHIHDVSATVLCTLARLQGTREMDLIEEQPGKIIHEHWDSEPTPRRVHAIPFVAGSTYCGFDQTFLFIIAVRRFLELFPDSQRKDVLWAAAKAAITWMTTYGYNGQSGLFAYSRRHWENPIHQVWKDSFDSITHAGFDIPISPTAWIEVQGYAYRAILDAAYLYETFEEKHDLAKQLITDAATLRRRVDERFWLPDQNCYAVAVDGNSRPVAMVTSNCGHTLWAGLPEHDRAISITRRLQDTDILTQYGIRTLSDRDQFFVPHGYHRGAIWPFDNAVVVWGMLQYGLDDQARRVLTRVIGALSLVGTPIELYVVIAGHTMICPSRDKVSVEQVLLHRQHPPQQVNQGFSVAGLLFCIDALAALEGITLNEEVAEQTLSVARRSPA